jgi:uncharacterized protein
VRYTYDPKKRVANLKKHGYDFKHAPQVIESAASVTFEDRRFDYDEQRFITLGYCAQKWWSSPPPRPTKKSA